MKTESLIEIIEMKRSKICIEAIDVDAFDKEYNARIEELDWVLDLIRKEEKK